MTTARQRNELGRYGEDVAARYLVERGMVLLDRNWRCAGGELDLVLRDGETLVFCEVKTRRSDAYGHPLTAVTRGKAARLRRLGAAWLAAHQVRPAEVRVDLVGVIQSGHGAGQVEHVRGAG